MLGADNRIIKDMFMDESVSFLSQELLKTTIQDEEQEALKSLLNSLDKPILKRVGLKNICAHMAKWYEVAIEWFQFNREDKLSALFIEHHMLLQKVAADTPVVYTGTTHSDEGVFSLLFNVQPSKNTCIDERNFGRFVFYHVSRYLLQNKRAHDLKLMSEQFAKHYLKKDKIVVHKENILNYTISERVFPSLTKDLKKFITNYSYIQFSDYYVSKPSVTSLSEFLSEPDTKPENVLAVPQTLLSVPLRSTNIPNYPILPKNTDFQSFRRHDNQAMCLPWLTYSLSTTEKINIINELLSDIRGKINEALLYILMIQVGKNIDELLSIPIIWKNSVSEWGLYPSLNLFVQPHLSLKNHYEIKDESNAYLLLHQKFIYIPIITEVCDLVSQRDPQRQVRYFYQLFDITKFDMRYRNQIKLRANIKRRTLSDRAMQYLLFSEINNRSDQVCASLIFASDKFSNPTSLYYFTLNMKSSIQLYQQSASCLGLMTDIKVKLPNGNIGSELAVDTAKFRNRVGYLRDLIQESLEKPVNVEQFNNIVLYTCLIFMLNGFARRASHLFFESNSVSVTHKLLLMCDKYTEGYSAVRLLPLTEIAISQLDAYKKAVKYFAAKLTKQDKLSSELLYSQYKSTGRDGNPFLALIIDGELRPVGTADVMKWLDMKLPDNFSRHLMSSSISNELAPYRQVFLGHYNQRQHPNDPFRLNKISFKKEYRQMLNEQITNLGLTPIKISGIGGDYGNRRSKENVPIEYYPPNWLMREGKNKTVVKQLYRNMPFSLLTETIEENIDTGFLKLKKVMGEQEQNHQSIIEKYVREWSNYFKQTNSISLRQKYINQSVRVSTPLKVLEYDRLLSSLRERYLDYIARQELNNKTSGFGLFICCCLFQPDYAKRLFAEKPTSLTLQIINQTMIATFIDSNDVEQTYPLNALVVGLILKRQLSTEQIIFIWHDFTDQFKNFCGFMIITLSSSNAHKRFSTLNRFVLFCTQNNILTTSALLRTDGDNHSLMATHYPSKELIRLLLAEKFTERISFETPTAGYLKKRFITQNNINLEHERRTFKKFHRFFDKDAKDKKKTSEQFRQHWADILNVSSYDVDSLLKNSTHLSQFTQCFLWFMHDYSLRLSKKKTPYAPITLYNYFSTLNNALFARCSVEDINQQSSPDLKFTELDQETYIEIYREAISNTNKQDKQQLAQLIKKFHQRTCQFFGFDDIDWEAYFPELNEKFKVKGIARALSPSEYKRVFVYLQQYVHFTEYERSLHLTFLILGYRAGLRLRESKNLKLRDIEIDRWVINVAASHYSPTKSINSPRRINVFDYLSETEKQIIKKIVIHAKTKYRVHPSELLFSNTSDEPRIDIDQVSRNVNLVLRAVTGNPKFRYYDLRHTFINMNLMCLTEVRNDKRYNKLLTDWARTNDLVHFNKQIINNLLGGVANHGAALTLAFAHYMGHSVHTQREYYQHCLALVSEVEANQIVDRHLANKHRKEFHINTSHKLSRHFVEQVRLALRSIEIKGNRAVYTFDMPDFEMQLGHETALYQKYKHECIVLYNMIYCYQNIKNGCELERVNERHITAYLEKVKEFAIQTDLRSIPLNWYADFDMNIKHGLVNRYSRYINADSFQLLLQDLIIIYLERKYDYDQFSVLWCKRAVNSSFTVRLEEVPIVEKVSSLLNLELSQTDAFLPLSLKVPAKNIKLRFGGAKKNCMEKLSLALALIYGVT